ncbi:MAG: hypothetical protein KJ063_20895 [Anaerolineae bacterium]|nr:hypothetical protein [Anaerolineae bacterium]
MTKSTRHLHEKVYAIIRVDLFQGESVQLRNKITVKKVVRDREVAEKEVDRLNRLQAGKDVEYFWQMSRLHIDG